MTEVDTSVQSNLRLSQIYAGSSTRVECLSQGTVVFESREAEVLNVKPGIQEEFKPISFYIVSHTDKESNLSQPTKYTLVHDEVTQRDDLYMNPTSSQLIELQTSNQTSKSYN